VVSPLLASNLNAQPSPQRAQHQWALSSRSRSEQQRSGDLL